MRLTSLTLAEAANLINKGEISSFNLTNAHLELIHQIDGKTNSYINVREEQALQCARLLDERLRKGKITSPIHGVPVAVKDLFDVKGIPTTAGSEIFIENTPDRNAFVIDKLKHAGVVLLGKLNMHEIALGVTNVNSYFGDCCNPWSLDHISGGSSGGSAAALAAELCMGSLGSDTGGSIRIPASLCGVVGLKPTRGRVSLNGVFPLSWNLDHVGPMARRVRDVALLLNAIAGFDSNDPCSVDINTTDFMSDINSGINGWRMGFAIDNYFSDLDSQVSAAVSEASELMAELGANVERVSVPGGQEAARANGLMTVSDAAAVHRERLQTRPDDFGEDVRERLRMGAGYSSSEYVLARRTQVLASHAFRKFFEKYEVLITAATPTAAPLRKGSKAIEQARQLTRFTAPFNLTGLPAVSLPCGFTKEGLPIGLQLVTRPWNEANLLRAAHAYESAAKWYTHKPELIKEA